VWVLGLCATRAIECVLGVLVRCGMEGACVVSACVQLWWWARTGAVMRFMVGLVACVEVACVFVCVCGCDQSWKQPYR
jgi:hypothetical protein